MSTQKIWDIHLTYDGEVTEEFIQGTIGLAKSIAEEPGVVWKIWTQKEGTNEFGSTYLFKNLDYLQAYKEMHVKRLNDFGIKVTSDHIFDIMEDLSTINNAPI